MKRKFLIILIVLAIVLGLLFMIAYSGSVAEMKQKEKKPTAIPSVSINPYQIPLPIMEHSVKVAIRMPSRVK